MNKDEKAWSAIMIPLSVAEDEDVVGNAVKRTTDKLAHGLLDTLSDGKEYAVKLLTVQQIQHKEQYTAEIRSVVNMREIVRCKECVHHFTADCPLHFEYDPLDDWFCASGERQ